MDRSWRTDDDCARSDRLPWRVGLQRSASHQGKARLIVSAPREGEWTRDVCEQMTRCNAMILPNVAGRMVAPGWPDRLVWHRYWSGLLEFKGKRTRVEPHQKIKLRELRERQPGCVFVVRYPDRIEDENGSLIANFDGSGHGLIIKLAELRDEAERRSR